MVVRYVYEPSSFYCILLSLHCILNRLISYYYVHWVTYPSWIMLLEIMKINSEWNILEKVVETCNEQFILMLNDHRKISFHFSWFKENHIILIHWLFVITGDYVIDVYNKFEKDQCSFLDMDIVSFICTILT